MGKSWRFKTLLLLFLTLFSGANCRRRHQTQRTATLQKKDITTPLATNPTVVTPSVLPHSAADSDSDSSITTTTPLTVPSPPTYPAASWCVASESAAKMALQQALDYACGIVGADCSAIQPGGDCYYPNTLRDHSSFAFNAYYQKNPIPSSCNFGGTALTVASDPSTGACHYPSTSTSASILNVTNEEGLGIFGRVPSHPHPPPTTSQASTSPTLSSLLLLFICFTLSSFVQTP